MGFNQEYLTVRSVALHPNMGDLPTLIEDFRTTEPISSSAQGNVYIKPPAFPYTSSHLLIGPDRKDGKDMPGVADGDVRLLNQALQVLAIAGEIMIQGTKAETIDIGWNYSRFEVAKHIASQRKNLHFHVIGYEPGDLYPVSRDEIRRDPIQRSKMSEPMAKVGEEIFARQIVPAVNSFYEFFQYMPDSDPLTYCLKGGLERITEPVFAQMLQDIHQRGAVEYQRIASLLISPFSDADLSATSRPQPLNRALRTDLMADYLRDANVFSPESKLMLARQAVKLQSFDRLIEERQAKLKRALKADEKRHLLYLKAPVAGFAYSTTLSARVNPDRSVDQWLFGFDPVVYSSRDLIQSSRVQFKLFSREPQAALSDQQYAKLVGIEHAVREKF